MTVNRRSVARFQALVPMVLFQPPARSRILSLSIAAETIHSSRRVFVEEFDSKKERKKEKRKVSSMSLLPLRKRMKLDRLAILAYTKRLRPKPISRPGQPDLIARILMQRFPLCDLDAKRQRWDDQVARLHRPAQTTGQLDQIAASSIHQPPGHWSLDSPRLQLRIVSPDSSTSCRWPRLHRLTAEVEFPEPSCHFQ